jgi:transketolase N-terminal domain/subunit
LRDRKGDANMKNLTAVVRMNGCTKHIKNDEYSTKQEMQADLKANGFTVLGIVTDKEIAKIKETRLWPYDKEYKHYIQQL